MPQYKIGLIGLATMGANFARNFANHKISTLVFNRTTEKTTNFIEEFGNEYLAGAKEIKEFVSKLERPRKIIILVKAGEPVDNVIEELSPFLEKGDIIVDCGNSFFTDSNRREYQLREKGIYFIGCGISGGEEGALKGPSLMPGGDKNAYKELEKYFTQVAAKDFKNGKCVTYVGPKGSGHFVKMVHNGIEYAIMQLIAEAYDILRKIGKFSNPEIAKIFKSYLKNENLKSFLFEITEKVLTKKEGAKSLIDYIKDSAGQKGTGRWTTDTAMNMSIAVPTINSAVDARIISGDEHGRKASKNFKLTKIKTSAQVKKLLPKLVENSLELSIILSYEQGFRLINRAGDLFEWWLNPAKIARIWQGGCIIRSGYLKKLEVYMDRDQLQAKKMNQYITKLFSSNKQKNWRKLLSLAIENGIPVPALYASLNFYDSYSADKLPQNLIQAQRDFFGAHTYERIDKPGTFHTEWDSL